MNAFMIMSVDGKLIVTVHMPDSDPHIVVVNVDYMGVDCPPIPIPVQALKQLLEGSHGATKTT